MGWGHEMEPPEPGYSPLRLWATALAVLAIVVGWAVWSIWFLPGAMRGW